MSYYAILGLFLFKHGLLAHAVDFGYSYSRSAYRRSWWIGTISHCSLELTISQMILYYLGFGLCQWLLIVELTVFVISSWIERNAPLRRLVKTHLACELSVFVSYGFAVSLLKYP